MHTEWGRVGTRWFTLLSIWGAVLIGLTAHAAPTGQTVWLKACATNLYISADRARAAEAPLVAERASIQAGEQFQVVDAGGGYIALKAAATGQYVSADLNLGGALVANRETIQDWEMFQWVDLGNGSVALKARSNGRFVSADRNRGSHAPLYADRASAQCWESFTWGASGTSGGNTSGGGTSGGGTNGGDTHTGDWVKVWGDEFDGDAVDTSNWYFNTTIHVNNEQQQYTNSRANVEVSNGTLKLIARHEPLNGYPFTSGRLESKGLREFTYGRFEASIRLPVAEGVWPAFWLLGNNQEQVGWPTCGEIDIMENIGYADWTSGALHGPNYSGNTPINSRFTLGSPVSEWHVYRVDWSPSDIKWYIDGVLQKTTPRSEVERYGRWVFDHPFFITLNLAVGGEYPLAQNGVRHPYVGVPQATVDLFKKAPQQMEVDWVRVYQLR